MMNDHELDLALERLVAEHKGIPAPRTLHERVWAIPTSTPPIVRRSSWLGGSRFATLFRATGLLVGAVIIALAGGLLFSAAQPSPVPDLVVPTAIASATPRVTVEPSPSALATSAPTDAPENTVQTDLLPGVDLEYEELSPGVFRVVSDGVRELTWDPADGGYGWGEGPARLRTVVGRDGSVWQFKEVGADEVAGCRDDGCLAFYRLGDPAIRHLGPRYFRWGDVEIGADGVVWAVVGRLDDDGLGAELRSFDGDGWTRQTANRMKAVRLALDADGAVWLSWFKLPAARTLVGHLVDGEWDVLGRDVEPETLVADPDYGVTVANTDGGLHRLGALGNAGDFVSLDGTALAGLELMVGDDGGYWWLSSPQPDTWQLVRYDDTDGWSTYDAPMDLRGYRIGGVSRGGEVWLYRDPLNGTRCEGVVAFDGSSWSRYMQGYCPFAMDLGQEGSVWLQATLGEIDLHEPEDGPIAVEPGLIETFVIAPWAPGDASME